MLPRVFTFNFFQTQAASIALRRNAPFSPDQATPTRWVGIPTLGPGLIRSAMLFDGTSQILTVHSTPCLHQHMLALEQHTAAAYTERSDPSARTPYRDIR